MTTIRGPILDRLGSDPSGDNRIFTVELTVHGTFLVREACDGYFVEELTADELRALGLELIAAADA
jgi:hypothetical protein